MSWIAGSSSTTRIDAVATGATFSLNTSREAPRASAPLGRTLTHSRRPSPPIQGGKRHFGQPRRGNPGQRRTGTRAAASGRRQAASHELSVEIELGRADRNAAGHGPEDLELEAVGVLRVKGETHAVVRRADERPRVEQALARSRQIGELADFPRQWYMRATRSSGRATPVCSNRP